MYSGQDAPVYRAAASPEEERAHHVEDKARRLKSLWPNSLVGLLKSLKKCNFQAPLCPTFKSPLKQKNHTERKKNASAAQSVSSSLVTKVDFSVNKDNSKHNILKKISMVFFKSFFFSFDIHTHTLI